MKRAGTKRSGSPASAAIGLALLLAATGFSGCSKPLLSPSDTRSPFDRYDAVRNQYATQYIEDEFGRERPNIRARLTPRQ
jgi:hypothetical protein